MKTKRGNGQGSFYRNQPNGRWQVRYFNHEGRRVDRSTGATCRRTAERIFAKWIDDDVQRRMGLIDPRAEAMVMQARRPIGEHLAEWKTTLRAPNKMAR